MKKFSIYCSGNAARVVRLYSNGNNKQIMPTAVVYDGEDVQVMSNLKAIFGNSCYVVRDFGNQFDSQYPNISTSRFILKVLTDTNTDFLISFGKRILRGKLLSEYRNRILNFHPSLLPSFKGLSAIDQATSFGSGIIGNSVHVVVREVDSGQVILQSAMSATDVVSYEDVLELQMPMFKVVLRDVCKYKISDAEIMSDIVDRQAPYLMQSHCHQITCT